jgi:FixJ family two-component response regulator
VYQSHLIAVGNGTEVARAGKVLATEGLDVRHVASAADLGETVAGTRIVLAIDEHGQSALDDVARLASAGAAAIVILSARETCPIFAATLFKAGAIDILEAPFAPADLLEAISAAEAAGGSVYPERSRAAS